MRFVLAVVAAVSLSGCRSSERLYGRVLVEAGFESSKGVHGPFTRPRSITGAYGPGGVLSVRAKPNTRRKR